MRARRMPPRHTSSQIHPTRPTAPCPTRPRSASSCRMAQQPPPPARAQTPRRAARRSLRARSADAAQIRSRTRRATVACLTPHCRLPLTTRRQPVAHLSRRWSASVAPLSPHCRVPVASRTAPGRKHVRSPHNTRLFVSIVGHRPTRAAPKHVIG